MTKIPDALTQSLTIAPLAVIALIVGLIALRRHSAVGMLVIGGWLCFYALATIVAAEQEFGLVVSPFAGAIGLTLVVTGIKAINAEDRRKRDAAKQ